MAAQKNRILTYFQSLTERQVPHVRILGTFFGVSMLGFVAAFAVAPDSLPERLPMQTVLFPLAPPLVPFDAGDAGRFLSEDRVLKNDTLASLLNRLAIEDAEALDFIRRDAAAAAISRQLRPGKAVSAYTDGNGRLLRLHFPLNGDGDTFVVVERNAKGLHAGVEVAIPERQVVIKAGEIRSSLFGATDAAGIPDAIAVQLAEIFGGDIDFHRDLRKRDRFAVTYEALSIRGQVVRSGRILAAEFVNGERALNAVYHANAAGAGGYYDAEGKSLRKAFLRSPLEFSRITSGFAGARFHPVLKEWRAHRGVDYGAAIGTRVRTTGDGIIEFAGRQGGYGNLVVVRHAGEYSTAYGHLKAFAAGMGKGVRVRQGDIIGYVGQTGLASGPHLHYEFRVRNEQVNPLAISLPEAPPLDTQALAAFRPQAQEALGRLQLAQSSTATLFE